MWTDTRSSFAEDRHVWCPLKQTPWKTHHRKGAKTMAIKWVTSFDEGLQKARGESRLILLDFFNPN
jgi:hypothetical protein